jgi:hypothetical protein
MVQSLSINAGNSMHVNISDIEKNGIGLDSTATSGAMFSLPNGTFIHVSQEELETMLGLMDETVDGGLDGVSSEIRQAMVIDEASSKSFQWGDKCQVGEMGNIGQTSG